MIKRRQFIDTLAIGSLAAVSPLLGRAATTGRVVVVGGGMAGATAAKYLRLWSSRSIEVTVVEPSAAYTSNIMSNLVVTGQYDPSILRYDWSRLVSSFGVKLVRGAVTAVVPGAAAGTWVVSVAGPSGTTTLPCDRVVLAPGIQFDEMPMTGATAQAAPVLHAWQAGPQTVTLRDQLRSLPATGTFVMTIPKAPYRCPPGPYERACVVADYLKRNKPAARIVVLDANADIVAEKENFSRAFTMLYGANLTYLPGRTVTSAWVEAGKAGGSVDVSLASGQTERHAADVLNVIPPHRAGAIVQTLGLADATGYAPVDGRSFESTLPGKAGLHVIGDASKTTLPKAGHVGNQGAKICADAIVRAFAHLDPYPTPTANSACFSPISNTQASWLTAIYQYEQDAATGAWRFVARDQVSGLTGATEAAGATSGQFSDMHKWYRTLMAETFT